MHLEPVAVIGRSALFPLSPSIESFAQNIFSAQDCTRELSEERFGLSPDLLKGQPGQNDKSVCMRAGFIDYDIDLRPFEGHIPEISQLDPYYQWVLHLIQEALKDASMLERIPARTGLILGNLTFATESAQAAFEQAIAIRLLQEQGRQTSAFDSREPNWHQSALPALLAAKVFGLQAETFALDAACASGLYAIELACRALLNREADVMLAMGVNRCEMAALTVGFSQLGALSSTGECRPFSDDANGLVVGEGGGALVLKRLSDAVADGDEILALIRGGGLSCDGKAGGLLAPDSSGQVQAMQKAWDRSGLTLDRVQLIECHGTGTTLGDATEIQSMQQLLSGYSQNVVVGSVKSQIGHCLSAAGMAAALKAMESIIHHKLPPTLHSSPAPALEGTQLKLLKTAQEWKSTPNDSPLVSAASGFGFGGTNAHIIFEEWKGQKTPPSSGRQTTDPIVITGVELSSGHLQNTAEVLQALQEGRIEEQPPLHPRWPQDSELSLQGRACQEIDFALGRFRISPREAERLLPQQLLVLTLAHQMLQRLESKALPPARTGVIVGMGFMANITDHTLRLKAPRLLQRLGHENPSEELIQTLRDAICPPVNTDDVIGDIPNFPANRISSEMDFRAPSYVVFQEEGSSMQALKLALETIRYGDADHMLVGSVDLPLDYREKLCEHLKGIQARELMAEGGAVLLLEKESLAIGSPLARIQSLDSLPDPVTDSSDIGDPTVLLENELSEDMTLKPLTQFFGCHRSAQGLFATGALSLCLANQMRVEGTPWLLNAQDGNRTARLVSRGGLDRVFVLNLQEFKTSHVVSLQSKLRLAAYRGKTPAELLTALQKPPQTDFADRQPQERTLSLIANSDEGLQKQIQKAKDWLKKSPERELRDPRGLFYQPRPILDSGQSALLYPGFGNLYPDLGRKLMLKLPALQKEMEKRTSFSRTLALGDRLWQKEGVDLFDLGVFEISFATTWFQCLMTELVHQQMKFQPDAIIGFSGGEINCLNALRVWDMDHYYHKATQDRVFSEFLCNEFKTLRRHVDIEGPVHWMTTLISTTPTEFQTLAAKTPGVYLCMQNAPGEIMVAGIRERLEPILKKGGWHITPLPIPQAYHCELALDHQAELHTLWQNPSTVPPNLRFYAHATAQGYKPDTESLATNIVRTCCEYVDFIPVIENAFKDGVRLFVETGPQSSVSRMVQSILKDKPHHVITLNSKERGEEAQLLFGIAEMLAHGASMDLKSLEPWLVQPQENRRIQSFPVGRTLSTVDIASLAAQTRSNPPTKPLTQPSRSIMSESPFLEAQLEFMQKSAEQQNLFLQEQAQSLALEVAAPGSPELQWVAEQERNRDEGLMPSPNPMFGKEHCRAFADGKLADVFGPEFAVVDSFRFRTRYPTPPYLLVDRVVSLDAEAKSLKPGFCVTEFDVRRGDWFLVDNRVPICVSIESGQADLFLISYLGIDEKVQGERVYRLLGADFTLYGELPEAPCTLRYEIEIKSFVEHNGVWLFFFEGKGYANNRPFIQWRNGCAGYFTPEELAAKKEAICEEWSTQAPAHPFVPIRDCRKNSFERQELEALARGDVYACFGAGFEVPFPTTSGQDFFPRLTNPDLLMIDQIKVDRNSGKHGLGYLESSLSLQADHWYFTSHFVTDNVMPGTLMLDGCSQLLRFYLLYLGFGFQDRGGVFHAVPDEEIQVKCSGQVIPGMQELITRMHVTRIEPGSRPRVYADAIMYCDGKEVVNIQNLAWEIHYSELPALPAPGEPATDKFGRAVHTNETQLIELTVGKPSRVFGEHYKRFDDQRQISRMPNPPYACITRVLEIEGETQKIQAGARILNEYDLDPEDWHFRAHQQTLPFCVLNEVVLQPCGLLPQLLQLDTLSESDRFIRNLGGRMITHHDLFSCEDRIIADVVLKEVVNTPDTFMVKYDGTYTLSDGTLIAEGRDLHFGFFSKDGLSAAPGLTLKQQDKALIEENNAASALVCSPDLPLPEEIGTVLKLPQWPALFFDEAVELRPEGGRFKQGYLKVTKDVDPSEWIFYSHFYMDPVVPGSYSLDACTQALRYYMLYMGLDQGMGQAPYFRINQDEWMDWQYRGQILQQNSRIEYILEIREIGEDENGVYASALARVICDGKHIYSLDHMRVCIQRNG